MKKKIVRMFGVSAIAVIMTLSMAACNTVSTTAESTKPSESTTVTESSTADEKTMSEATELSSENKETKAVSPEDEKYITEVKAIYTDIQTASTDMATQLAKLDPDADAEALAKTMIEATKNMVDTTKPLYEKLGNLKAPANYEEAQKKINSGVDASLQLLDISLQMMSLSEDPDGASKVTDLQTKAAELADQVTDLTLGINEVLGITSPVTVTTAPSK